MIRKIDLNAINQVKINYILCIENNLNPNLNIIRCNRLSEKEHENIPMHIISLNDFVKHV